MTWLEHVLFLACVALATSAQTMTGFAFGLVLLGLAGLLLPLSLADMANVVNLLTLVNAAVALRGGQSGVDWRLMWPALISSLCCVVVGVWLLGHLNGHMVLLGQALLGITILVCALLLVVRVRPRANVSSQASFWFFGSLSGLLGGLFSASGPPMVFHLYRQPLALDVIRNSLVALFAVNAVLRLGLVGLQGRLSATALWLGLEALPVVVFLTWFIRRHGPRGSLPAIRRVVFVLLWLAGLGLLVPAWQQL